ERLRQGRRGEDAFRLAATARRFLPSRGSADGRGGRRPHFAAARHCGGAVPRVASAVEGTLRKRNRSFDTNAERGDIRPHLCIGCQRRLGGLTPPHGRMLESGCELSSRFVLVRRLGGGSSGEVWLARDRAQERDVALKLLHANWVGQERAVAALEREYALLHRLRHPNILRVEDLERAGGLVWVVMEYAARGSLAQWRGRALGELLPMLLPVVSALRYVHTQGVVHRDIKPANVLLMADGTPKLADFEAAAHMDGDAPMRGSPFNMSPQQLAGAPPVASDDVYALGATLYELLSGYPPFYPDARPERVWNERPAPLPSSVPAA